MINIIHIYAASGSGTSTFGSCHPEHKDMYYPINYGYVEGVLAPDGMTFTKEEIREQIHFQEQYFDSEIVM